MQDQNKNTQTRHGMRAPIPVIDAAPAHLPATLWETLGSVLLWPADRNGSFPALIVIRPSEVKSGLQPAAFTPLQTFKHMIGQGFVLLTGWGETTMAQSEWVRLFYWKALANESGNSCWAGWRHTQPTFRLTAPSAGGCGPCYLFVSCQATPLTLQCCSAVYKLML